MPKQILDPKLVAKVAAAKRKPEKYIRETVSKFAHRQGVSSEAALVVLAKQSSIGTAIYQRRLDSAKQAEVRDLLTRGVREPTATKAARRQSAPRAKPASKRASLKLATSHLLQDPELRSRCLDLLDARSRFDRAINQATLVLEDRIRKKAKPPARLPGESLVNFAFKDDVTKTVLRVASGEADDQRGFTNILRGIVPAFRNQTHHHITENFPQEDAILVVGFVDVLLRVVETAVDTRPPAGDTR